MVLKSYSNANETSSNVQNQSQINDSSRELNQEDVSHKWPQILATIIATLAALNSGLVFSWTSSAIPHILSDECPGNYTFEQVSYLAITPLLSVFFTGPLCAYLIDKIGRKPLIMFVHIPYLLSWIMITFGSSLYLFYAARLVAGISDAICFGVVPLYIGEICEPNVRGVWGNALTFQLYSGQLLINIIGSYANISTTALLCCTVPLLGLSVTWTIPESPYFLLMTERENEARIVLKKLRKKRDVEKELGDLSADVKRQISETGKLKDLFVIKTNRKALLIAMGLRAAQQFSGISVFLVYSQYIFKQANGNILPTTSSIIFTALIVVLNFVSAMILDKLGRRLSVIISCAGSGIALIVECIFFYCSEYTHMDVSDFQWVPLFGMCLYVLFYSVGLGIAPILMLGELFSASIKGKALIFLDVMFVIYVIGTAQLFQRLIIDYGLFVPFAIYAACCFLSILFTYYCLPETKGKTLEEIQQMLKQN